MKCAHCGFKTTVKRNRKRGGSSDKHLKIQIKKVMRHECNVVIQGSTSDLITNF